MCVYVFFNSDYLVRFFSFRKFDVSISRFIVHLECYYGLQIQIRYESCNEVGQKCSHDPFQLSAALIAVSFDHTAFLTSVSFMKKISISSKRHSSFSIESNSRFPIKRFRLKFLMRSHFSSAVLSAIRIVLIKTALVGE